MPIFAYIATDGEGKIHRGRKEAEDEQTLRQLLTDAGFKVKQVKVYEETPSPIEQAAEIDQIAARFISQHEVKAFTRQLVDFLSRGQLINTALENLAEPQQNQYLKQVLIQMHRAEVEFGSSFGEAVALYPNVFGKDYIAKVRRAEQSGRFRDLLVALGVLAGGIETRMDRFSDIDSPTEHTLLVAFTDVTGFAAEFQNRTNGEMFDLMSQLYELIGNEVDASGGKVVKFIGDAALLVYPEENTKQAVEALQHLRVTSDNWLKAHGLRGEFHIRAHIGPVICGPLGTVNEKRFDVLGDTVNVTALLQSDGFTISPELQRHLQSSMDIA